MADSRRGNPGRRWHILGLVVAMMTGATWIALSSALAAEAGPDLPPPPPPPPRVRRPVVRRVPRAAAAPNWVVNPATGGSYAAIDVGTWRECQAAAADLAARLVTIDTDEEQKWLLDTFGGDTQYWIGLTDARDEGDWRWAGGETLSYGNWAMWEPNNSGGGRSEDFAHMNGLGPGLWNDLGPGDLDWATTTKAIIERPASVVSTNMRWKTDSPWRFDITGAPIVAGAATASVVPDGTTFDADLGGWRRWFGEDRQRSHRAAEIVWDSAAGSNVVQFTRVGGGADGSHVGIVRNVNVDLTQHRELRIQLEVNPVSSSLRGGGHAGGSEYPVCVELAYLDEAGMPHRWQHGFYYQGEDTYASSTKLQRGVWYRYTSPPLTELTPLCGDPNLAASFRRWFRVPFHRHRPASRPARITHVAVFAGGWDFSGRVDNVRFVEAASGKRPVVTPGADGDR